MRITSALLLAFLALPVAAATKPHSVSLGKALPVKLFVGPSENQTIDVSVRPLMVDSRTKDFTTGNTHDVTDREFVVRRAYRINDSLPDEPQRNAKWLWQRGNWLLVNRTSGKVTVLKLPYFDPFYSDISWYRDYAAYCGISQSGEQVMAVVAEIGNNKPLYRKDLGKNTQGDAPDSNCSAPRWERQPARVTFLPKIGEKFTVSVNGRFADEADSNDEE